MAKHKQILIIEDAEDDRLLLSRMMGSAGFDVHAFGDVESGYQSAKTTTPHLVLLDLAMEGADGYVFLERRLKDPVLKQVPVIVVSGMNDHLSIVRAISSGATDYMLKPVRTRELLMRVARLLGTGDTFTVEFSEKPEKATLSVPGTVVQAGDTSVLVESPIRFANNAVVELRSELFARKELQGAVWSNPDGRSLLWGQGVYRTRIFAAGLRSNLKRILKGGGSS
jgi:DNA-binding response OmpR family regulator